MTPEAEMKKVARVLAEAMAAADGIRGVNRHDRVMARIYASVLSKAGLLRESYRAALKARSV